MKKDWVLKQWIKEKLGIADHNKPFRELGQAIADGLAKGMEETTEQIRKENECHDCKGAGVIKYGDQYDDSMTCHKCKGTGKQLVTIEIPEHLHRAVRTNAKKYAEQIHAFNDKPLDKTDTMENVHDVRKNGGRLHIHDGKVVNPDRNNHTIIDPLIESFTDTVWEQQEKVLAVGKYPHPIHKDNHTASEWLDHQMSEFADALVYRECLRQTLQDVAHLIHQARDFNREQQNEKGYVVHAILGDALDRLGKVK